MGIILLYFYRVCMYLSTVVFIVELTIIAGVLILKVRYARFTVVLASLIFDKSWLGCGLLTIERGG